jgi:hypothetical protein
MNAKPAHISSLSFLYVVSCNKYFCKRPVNRNLASGSPSTLNAVAGKIAHVALQKRFRGCEQRFPVLGAAISDYC